MDGIGPVLIVDDEVDILNLVKMTLEREGFTTISATSGQKAVEMVQARNPSLVILDLMLPDMPGTEVCRRIRTGTRNTDLPVIMLSARGEEIDRVVGFEVGADDYVVKSSFSARELVLRVRAVLRRRAAAEEEATDRLEFQHVMIDEAAHRVWVDEEEISLTATEFRLLMVLARREGKVQTRGTLLQDVWEMPPDLNTRTVDTHVKRLREKLGAASVHVETVRGVGYRFTALPVD